MLEQPRKITTDVGADEIIRVMIVFPDGKAQNALASLLEECGLVTIPALSLEEANSILGLGSISLVLSMANC